MNRKRWNMKPWGLDWSGDWDYILFALVVIAAGIFNLVVYAR